MYGKTVLGLDGDRFEDALDEAKAAKGVTADVELDADDLRALVAVYRTIVEEETGPALPAGPARAAAGRRAGRVRLVELRPRHPLPPPRADPDRPRHRRQRPGHGLRQPWRSSGLRGGLHARTRHRRRRRLRRLPPGRAGRGRRRRHPQHPAPRRPRAHRQDELRRAARASWRGSRATTATCATSSSPSSRASSGCCRPGSASAPPPAAFRIAVDLVDEGVITEEEALHAGHR